MKTGETGMSTPGSDASIRAVAALEDQLRRGMYAYIRQASRPVSRDEAAGAVGISRKLAAFHLDKLVEAGVLSAHYAPLSGIRKVGRSPKVYEPSGLDIRVNIPQRQHELLAAILLDAVLAEDDESARAAAVRVAQDSGAALGREEQRRSKPGRLGTERALTLVAQVLSGHGFTPRRESPDRLRLRDCPFHPLSGKAPGFVCEVNRSFCAGVLAGLDATTVTAVLEPKAGSCCVELCPVERGSVERGSAARHSGDAGPVESGAGETGSAEPREREHPATN
ncbi:MAG TPA: transcriptional regulator [Pseudonocardiaceae bacterium]